MRKKTPLTTFALVTLLLSMACVAKAQVPTLLEYEGYLEETIWTTSITSTTSPVTGNRTILVKVYDASVNGTLLYQENIGTVMFTDGQFYFQYGQNGTAPNATTPMGIVPALAGNQHWLELTVNGTAQFPRERIVSVPFALKAGTSTDAQKTDADLKNVASALGKVIDLFGGNSSNLVSNPTGAVATIENTVKELMEVKSRFRVISLSGNLSFGNSTAVRNFTITNSGFDKLTIRGISYPEGFSGIAFSGELAAGQSKVVTVSYKPTDPKSYTGNIVVASDATSGSNIISASGLAWYQVSTLAGSTQGFADGVGTSAKFSDPTGVAVDTSGNVYVSDASNYRIRKITTSGTVKTLAGSGIVGTGTFPYDNDNGNATTAKFKKPSDVAVDTSGNVYVVDFAKIRRVTPAGIVTTIPNSSSIIEGNLNYLMGLAVDKNGYIYVSEIGSVTGYNPATGFTSSYNHIRKLSQNGTSTSLAGGYNIDSGYLDGFGNNAKFFKPRGVSVDGGGNVYVADTGNNRIRKISPSGYVTTIAGSGNVGSGDGQGISASFKSPEGVTVDAKGNVYVADTGNNRIRKISPTGSVSTIAGTGSLGANDGNGNSASFNSPTSIAVDGSGNLYVADIGNHRIRKLTFFPK